MKSEEDLYPLIRRAAKGILDSGGKCSTELVARAAGLPLTETPKVFRACASDPELVVADWGAPGYTVFKRRAGAAPR